MLLTIVRLGSGYLLRPWRSPYLRWRIETYWGIPADRITFGMFWRFVWQHKWELLRYLRWAVKGRKIIGGGAGDAPALGRLNAAFIRPGSWGLPW